MNKDAVTPETLTDKMIREARLRSWIDRETYEGAMYGGTEALDRVCAMINSRRRSNWIENVTP